MGFDYIRKTYGVNPKRGMLVENMNGEQGRVLSAKDMYVRVRIVGEKRGRLYHPTDLIYPQADGITIPIPDINKGDKVKLKTHGNIGKINKAEVPGWKIDLEYTVWRESEFNKDCVDLFDPVGYLELHRIHKSRLYVKDKKGE